MDVDLVSVLWDNVLRYDPETITIPAGSFLEVPATTSYVGFLSATTDNLLVSFNGSTYQPLSIGLLVKAPVNKAFRRLFIRNPGGAPNTVTVVKGLGDFEDNRLVLSSTSIVTTNPVPSAYSGSSSIERAVGAAFTNGTLVAGGANIAGVLVLSAFASGRSDPTAEFTILAGANWLLKAYDSQAQTLAGQLTIPAGTALSYSCTGGGVLGVTYRVL